MNKTRWMILGLAAMMIALGGWTNDAAAQGPPPDDEMEMMLDLDGPPGPPPGPGMRREMRSGREGFRERGDRPFKKKALDKIKKDDPERYRRLEKIKALAEKYRETDDVNQQRQIEKELRPLVEKELAVQQENHQQRIEELEKKLKHMKKVLKQREENWDQVVDHTVKEITGQNDYLHVLPGRPRR